MVNNEQLDRLDEAKDYYDFLFQQQKRSVLNYAVGFAIFSFIAADKLSNGVLDTKASLATAATVALGGLKLRHLKISSQTSDSLDTEITRIMAANLSE